MSNNSMTQEEFDRYQEAKRRSFMETHWPRAKMLLSQGETPDSVARQMAAVLTQKNRKPELGSVAVPTLVIHGADDQLVAVDCGKEIADAIPGAKLIIIEGMGHDLPHGGNGAWPQIVEAIINHTQKIST